MAEKEICCAGFEDWLCRIRVVMVGRSLDKHADSRAGPRAALQRAFIVEWRR